LRIADFHTYFAGNREWGFSIWAHNTYNNVRYNGRNGKQLDKLVEREVQQLLKNGERPAAVIGAYDISTGQFVIGRAGGNIETLPIQLIQRANRVGGLGARVGNTTVGRCAEVQAAAKLMRRGSNIDNIRFTPADGVRGPGNIVEIPTCSACLGMFSELF
jgi:hypothetical protein